MFAQGFITPYGQRKLLLVNKRSQPIDVKVPGAKGGSQQVVDESTTGLPATRATSNNIVHLAPLAVVVVTLGC